MAHIRGYAADDGSHRRQRRNLDGYEPMEQREEKASLHGLSRVVTEEGKAKVWHHKTMHKKFTIGVPLVFALQVALAIYIHVRA